MAQNTLAVFALKPETKVARITAATTDKTGDTTTNIVTLLTGATDGTKVTWVKFKFEGTSTAGIALIWVTDTADADNYFLDGQAYSAITTSDTVETAETIFYFNDLQLKSGQKLKVGITTATSSCVVTASIGDLS